MEIGMGIKHVFIFCGGHREAARYAKGRCLHPLNWSFIDKPEKLRGLSGGYYVRLKSYQHNKQRDNIEIMLKDRGMIEVRDVSLKHQTQQVPAV